jgi:hypothetical protein
VEYMKKAEGAYESGMMLIGSRRPLLQMPETVRDLKVVANAWIPTLCT